MDSFEWNKVAGAVLLAVLVVMAIREVASSAYPPAPESASAYAIATEEGSHTAAEDAPEVPDLAQLLAQGDPALGQRVFGRCRSCHTVEQDGGNRVGPNLFNTVGAALGTTEGFRYSQALLAKGGSWTYEALDAWLASPRDYIRGNKMAYAGLRKPEDRANLILYLRRFNDAPPPLPAVEAVSSDVEIEAPTEEPAEQKEPEGEDAG